MPLLARNVVAASQPLAAQAGLRMLLKGGNAVDAAIACAITLTVVEPTSNGLGSDAFAMVWDGQRLHGLNASGRSPAAWNAERFVGRETMPQLGWEVVTVPGAVSGWVALSEKFGRLPLKDLFEPAIQYAREGFPVSSMIAGRWKKAEAVYKDFPEFGATFLPNGRAPYPGEVFRCLDQAETLETIADSKGEAFYRGRLAEQIAAHAHQCGGALTFEDLANHAPDWVEPLSFDYRGVRIHELPPNSQGVIALIALGLLSYLDLDQYPVDSPESLHVQIEAMKRGFLYSYHHIGNSSASGLEVKALLNAERLAEWTACVEKERILLKEYPLPQEPGTVYLTAADASGMMVSFIQSNFMGFGSGVVVPETGISLQNRGYGFSLQLGHPNQVAGKKRPYHTLMPGFMTTQGKPVMSFGVMGGGMQPQGHVQMITRIVDYGQNPQAASDGPRWRLLERGGVALENGFASSVTDDLIRRGHGIKSADQSHTRSFGGAQLIYRLEDGYLAASDHRRDGQAVGF